MRKLKIVRLNLAQANSTTRVSPQNNGGITRPSSPSTPRPNNSSSPSPSGSSSTNSTTKAHAQQVQSTPKPSGGHQGQKKPEHYQKNNGKPTTKTPAQAPKPIPNTQNGQNAGSNAQNKPQQNLPAQHGKSHPKDYKKNNGTKDIPPAPVNVNQQQHNPPNQQNVQLSKLIWVQLFKFWLVHF